MNTQLTPLEKNIVNLVALKGYTNKEVAIQVGTTEAVIKNYMRIIFDKMGVWSRLELCIMVHNQIDVS